MARTAAILAFSVIVASCAANQPPPQQVDASSPTVTYKYHDDNELIEVNRRAEAHCQQYNFTSHPKTFSTNSDGRKSVIFDCVPTAMTATKPVQSSNLVYTYRTDQELLAASRSAEAHCKNNGYNQVSSNIVTNSDGSKTATFQCQA